MPPTSSRSRGGQPGNLNAVKHGFYTRHLRKRDLTGVESASLKGLVEEIALIRIYTRRLVEASTSGDDVYELAGILRVLCLASLTITRIIKAQTFFTNSSFEEDITEAIRQVNQELRRKSALPPGEP